VNRRLLLQSIFAASLPLNACAVNGRQQVGSLSDPDELLTTFMRLACSLDNRLIIWWMDGVRYGVVDAKTKALFGMKVGMFHRFFRQADGNYTVAMFELTYYTDLHSGELLESFDNPYTGETNRVRHFRIGPELRLQTSTGLARPENPMVKEYQAQLGPALIRGDHVWIPTDIQATIRCPKPTAPSIQLNHYTTAHGRLSDATNPKIMSALCEFNFQNIIKWEPFMNMGDHRGHMMSRAAGRKLESVSELPADYRAIAERMHGKYMADPVKTLEKVTADLL